MIDVVTMRGLWNEMIPLADRGSCVFRRQTSPGVYTDVAVSVSWFRQSKGIIEVKPTNGGYLGEKLEWYCPRELLPTQPLPGDLIGDFASQKSDYPLIGKTLVVSDEGCTAVNAEGTWKAEAIRPFFNPAKVELVKVERPQPRVYDGGVIGKGTVVVIAQNVPAIVQVSDTFGIVPVQSGVVFDKFQTPNPTRVHLNTVIRVQPKDRLTVQATGQVFTILNDANINILGEFMSLDCILHQ